MLNVLVITASPAERKKLDLKPEVDAIKTKFLDGVQGSRFHIEPIYDATVDILSNTFRRFQPEVLHFSGHALRGELLFEGGKSGQRVPRESFAQLIALLKERLRCVVLNACTSEAQAAELAPSVDCVIGMREGIDDDEAIAFSKGFYEALAWGDSVGKAAELGCIRVRMERSEKYPSPILKCRPGVDPYKVYLTTTLQTFCLSAESDRGFLDTLLNTHLAPLTRTGVLQCWEPGRALDAWDLKAETTKRLEAAQLILVLVSADLFSSAESYQLLLRALARHSSSAARVVPILVRRVDLPATPLSALPILPSSRKALSEYRPRDAGWFQVMKSLSTLIDDVLTAEIKRMNATAPQPPSGAADRPLAGASPPGTAQTTQAPPPQSPQSTAVPVEKLQAAPMPTRSR